MTLKDRITIALVYAGIFFPFVVFIIACGITASLMVSPFQP